jgi:hypothetical protein
MYTVEAAGQHPQEGLEYIAGQERRQTQAE